ncbi:right-handed parallel beta-helix repeat-containing protein [bacterium]|nr:right-handed parallel beta-helix repeat-containing protein [bacterium]
MLAVTDWRWISMNLMYRTLLATVALAVSSVTASAETITVCASGCDYTSINAAIDAASDGDVIQLAAETYFEGEQIDTLGKAITLRGVLDKAGEPASVLDGAGTHRVLICQGGETNATLFENLLIKNGFSVQNGGGLLIQASGPTVQQCVFLSNLAFDGGGVFNGAGSEPTFRKCRFESNQCVRWAGGIANFSGSAPLVLECVFVDNRASNAAGGGVRNSESGNVVFEDCRFESNSALYAAGMSNSRATGLRLTRCEFVSNVSQVNGGGLLNFESPAVVEYCVFTSNRASNGGGFYDIGENAGVDFDHCDFSDNVGSDDGGGVWFRGNDPAFVSCTFSGNFAACTGYDCGRGGAVFFQSSSPLFDGCDFVSNSGSAGGAVFAFSGGGAFDHCEFRGNQAVLGNGGALLNRDSSPGMSSCVFEENSASTGFSLAIFNEGVSRPAITNCMFLECCQIAPPNSFIDGGNIFAGNPYSACDICRADISCDTTVNSADLGLLIGAWGTSDSQCDINGDGTVSAADLGLLIGAWGPCQ